MEKTRTSYSTEEKLDIVLSILTKKTSIQTVAREKGIAATLISLWKKQALDAIESRFVPQPKGRRKLKPEVTPESAAELKAARREARALKIKSSRLETSLRESREKLVSVETQLKSLASTFGCTLTKVRKPRGRRKSRKD